VRAARLPMSLKVKRASRRMRREALCFWTTL
jgi:hypothetical protein